MSKVVKTTALGDIVDLVMGQAPPSKDTNFERRGTPFVKVGEFGEVRPVIREWTTNPLRMAKRTDVLLCVVGATCGKINLGEECAIGRSVAAIRPDPLKLDQFYLYYFMMTLVECLRSGSVGAAQTVISKEMVQEVQIPLPPLSEQQRIVGLLDEAFADLATAQAHAEKNLQNARALFESHLQSVFTQRGPGWVEKKLGDVATLQRGFDLPKQERVSGEYPLVSSSGISDTHHKSAVCGPGVVTGRSGSIGNVFFIEDDFWPLNTVLYVKDFHGNDPRFVFHLLNNFDLKRFATGSGVPTLNRNFVHDELVMVPTSVAKQKAIVTLLDALSAETQRLAAIYTRKLAALAALKQSLLHQAFAGEW